MNTEVKIEDLKPGLYWASYGDNWSLVKIENASYRPDNWFKEGIPKLEVFTMGWDCSTHVSRNCKYYLAELITPDGKIYKG